MPVPRDSRESNPQADKSTKSKARVEETNKTRLAEEANGGDAAKREPDVKRAQAPKDPPRSGSGTHPESTTQREGTATQREGTATQRESTPVQRESTLAQNSGTSSQREVSPAHREVSPAHREGSYTHREGSSTHTEGSPAQRESLPTQLRADAPAKQEIVTTHRDALIRREESSAQIDRPTESREVTQMQREISTKNLTTRNDVSYTKIEESVIPSIRRDLAKPDSPSREAHSETQDPTHRRTTRQHSTPEARTEAHHHESSSEKMLRGQVEYLSAPDRHTSKSSTHEIAGEFQDSCRSHVPYPGERGVVKFLDLLPEDVRHHIRWQSSLVVGNANVHSNSISAAPPTAASPVQTSTQRALNPTSGQDINNSTRIQNNSEKKSTQKFQVTNSKEPSSHTSPLPGQTKNYKSNKFIGEKRYITGVEIALAAIVSAAGIARNRSPLAPKGEAQIPELLTNDAPKTRTIQTSAKSDTTSISSEKSTLAPATNIQHNAPPEKPTVLEKSVEKTGSHAPGSINSDKVLSDGKRVALDRIEHRIASADENEHSDSSPNEHSTEIEHSGRKVVRTLQKATNELFGQCSEPKLFAVSSSDVATYSVETIAIVPSTEEEQLATYAIDVTRSRPKTLISLDDTLASIAEAFYHDANLGWLIADLNLTWSKETWVDGKRIVEFKNRQQVILPLWEDVMCFYSRRPSNADPENLVTVVVETAIDRELLDSELSTVIGGVAPKSKKRKPIRKDFK